MDEKTARTLIDNDTTWFEGLVLAHLINNPKFYSRVCSILCVNPVTGNYFNDFKSYIDGAIYKAINMYYLCMGGGQVDPMNMQWGKSLLQQLAKDGEGLIESDIQAAISRLEEIMSMNPGNVGVMVEASFTYWISRYRAQKVMSEFAYKKGWDPNDVISGIKAQLSSIEMTLAEDSIFEFGHGIDTDTLDVERLSSGLHKLDYSLGGGFGRKEGNLFIAGTGAGKTIAATQFGGAFALQNLKGVIITTEQSHEELEPRIISNFCNIPFEKVKDKIDLNILRADEKKNYMDFRDKIRGNLFISDWVTDNSKSVLQDLDDEVDKIANRAGGIDFLILDWIGGALGSMDLNRPEKIRHIYQATADKTWELAKTYNITTLAFAQGHPEKAVNRIRVDSSVLSECKSMGRNASYIIGITAMLKNQDDMVADKPTYTDRQFYYISKGRKSIGGKVPFHRDYAYQRMGNVY
jgi:hypothetical protein